MGIRASSGRAGGTWHRHAVPEDHVHGWFGLSPNWLTVNNKLTGGELGYSRCDTWILQDRLSVFGHFPSHANELGKMKGVRGIAIDSEISFLKSHLCTICSECLNVDSNRIGVTRGKAIMVQIELHRGGFRPNSITLVGGPSPVPHRRLSPISETN